MPVFEYKATDQSGRAVKGTLFSVSLVAAAEELSKTGLAVEHVALANSANDPIPQSFGAASRPQVIREQEKPVIPAEPPPTAPRSALMTGVVGPLILKAPLPQLLFFFRQLSTMLNAGVPIVSSLDTLARQTKDVRMRPVVVELAGHVREGRPLSVGMQRYPEVFTPLMLSLVRAGEESGLLDKTLNQMADYVEREIQLRNLIRKATLYPKLVIFCSIFVILAANYVIHSVFNKPGGIATPLTEPATWIVLTPMIVFLFLFSRVGLANSRVKYNYDHILLMVPGVGSTIHQMSMAKFSRAFSALYKGGVPVTKSVELAADACGNEALRAKIFPAGRALENGEGITDVLARTGAFSKTVLDMTQTGETTGRVDDMLEKVADFYEEDSTVKANQLAVILGVLCFLVVAAYVAYIVITFYTGHAGAYQGIGSE